jgi:hypothetical protein
MAKPSNHPLRTVVAATLEVIHSDSGYISPTKDPASNTQTKVLAMLQKVPFPDIQPRFWVFADEMIGLFRILDTLPEYKNILALPDGPMYKICVDTVKADEISVLSFPYIVSLPNLYAKLKPSKPKPLNPLKSEAKLIKPGEHMGTLNVEGRFFVKLMKVGTHDATKGGTEFVVNDRSGNVGIFYEVLNKLEGKIFLGDCFAMHATPHQQTEKNGEKLTFFRSVKVLQDTIVSGRIATDPANDAATGGKFTKGVSFYISSTGSQIRNFW